MYSSGVCANLTCSTTVLHRSCKQGWFQRSRRATGEEQLTSGGMGISMWTVGNPATCSCCIAPPSILPSCSGLSGAQITTSSVGLSLKASFHLPW